MTFLGAPCGGVCGSPDPHLPPCDLIAFTYGNGKEPIGSVDSFHSAEGVAFTFTLSRLPECAAGHGAPTIGGSAGDYYFDYDTSDFYRFDGTSWNASAAPAWYGQGNVTVQWTVVRDECGCSAHMIPAASGAVSWDSGDTSDKTFSITPTCPGPPTYWGCNGLSAGGEHCTIRLDMVTADRCTRLPSPGSVAEYVAVCTHPWPNRAGWSPSWGAQTTVTGGQVYGGPACNAYKFGGGVGTAFFQSRVTVFKDGSGVERGRIEEDFDALGMVLQAQRTRGVVFFPSVASPSPASDNHCEYLVIGGGPYYHWTVVVDCTTSAVLPLDFATGFAASPPLWYGINSGWTYDITSGGGWDETKTLNYNGYAVPAAGIYFPSASAQKYRALPDGYGGVSALFAKTLFDYRGSYAGNAHPARWGLHIEQYTYDAGTGSHSLTSSADVVVTDTTYEVTVAADEGYATATPYQITTPPPPGCPTPPAFVCWPGLPPCP